MKKILLVFGFMIAVIMNSCNLSNSSTTSINDGVDTINVPAAADTTVVDTITVVKTDSIA